MQPKCLLTEMVFSVQDYADKWDESQRNGVAMDDPEQVGNGETAPEEEVGVTEETMTHDQGAEEQGLADHQEDAQLDDESMLCFEAGCDELDEHGADEDLTNSKQDKPRLVKKAAPQHHPTPSAKRPKHDSPINKHAAQAVQQDHVIEIITAGKHVDGSVMHRILWENHADKVAISSLCALTHREKNCVNDE